MSLPSKPIQQLAPGFLSLMNLKNTGMLPDTVLGDLQPCIDLEGYFLRGAIVAIAQAVNIGAGSGSGFNPLTGGGGINGTVDFTTPNNEWWWVERMTASTTNLAAGDIMKLACAYTNPAVGALLVGDQVGVNPALANEVVACRATDFWVPPGSTVGLFGQYTIAGAESISVKLRVARLTG